jgi:hypothetical protein
MSVPVPDPLIMRRELKNAHSLLGAMKRLYIIHLSSLIPSPVHLLVSLDRSLFPLPPRSTPFLKTPFEDSRFSSTLPLYRPCAMAKITIGTALTIAWTLLYQFHTGYQTTSLNGVQAALVCDGVHPPPVGGGPGPVHPHHREGLDWASLKLGLGDLDGCIDMTVRLSE